MLGKMIVQGLVTAVLIGAAATVYAQTKGEDPSIDAKAAASTTPQAAAAVAEGNGYLTAPNEKIRKHDGKNEVRHGDHEHHRDGRNRGHDDDDD